MITTFTGKLVDPCALNHDDIDILDIAHALACVNRFGGMANKPHNVAQHSVYVSRLLEGTSHALQGLLHDASEAYLGDVTYWLKRTPQFQGYHILEKKVQCLIFEHFNCRSTLSPEVEYADNLMLRFEGHESFPKELTGEFDKYFSITNEEKKQVGRWARWNWWTAKESFLAEYEKLTK